MSVQITKAALYAWLLAVALQARADMPKGEKE